MPDVARPCPHPVPDRSVTRLRRRLATGAVAAPAWSPPPLPDLIARIDAALAERPGQDPCG